MNLFIFWLFYCDILFSLRKIASVAIHQLKASLVNYLRTMLMTSKINWEKNVSRTELQAQILTKSRRQMNRLRRKTITIALSH
jgi:hypothetical protein